MKCIEYAFVIILCISCSFVNGDSTIGAVLPTQCSPGEYENGLSCSSCPIGSYCPVGTSSPISCPAGSYSDSTGAVICKVCPPGHSCTSSAATACTNGYTPGGGVACASCPAGFTCSILVSNSPDVCPIGTYSPLSSNTCTSCPLNEMCTSAGIDSTCPAGTYSPLGSSQCHACPPGSVCSPSGSSPVECPSGTWSFYGQSTCTDCPANYACASNSDVPLYCDGGDQPIGSSSCSPCYGPFCPTTDIYCPPGQLLTGSSGSSPSCSTCPAGSFCPLINTITATPCPEGHYCPAGSSTPSAVSAGYYIDSFSSSSSSDGVTCPAGSACPQVGSVRGDPISCPAGYCCPAGSSTGTPVVAGRYKGSDATSCDTANHPICPAGSYCPEGSDSPIMCPPGTYLPTTGASSLSECLSCDAGYACPVSGAYSLSLHAVDCYPGHYCPSQTSHPTQYPCPAGTYSSAVSSTDISACTTCPAGYYCLPGTTDTSVASPYLPQPPIPCPRGQYCPSGTPYSNAYPCPAGTYLPSTGASSSSDCLVCPAGYYCLSGVYRPSGTCAAGYTCPAGSSSPQTSPCSAGTYRAADDPFVGRASLSCTTCPAGYYCVAGSSSPVACDIGYYSTTGSGACTICPAGSYCGDLATAPVSCGVGYFSGSGADSCLDCPIGYYCDSSTTTMSSLSSNQCGNGFLCNSTAMNHTPSHPDDSCPTGQYCLNGIPYSCPPGTYNPDLAGTSSSDCQTVEAGKYVINSGASSPDGDCSPHYYCPAGSTASTQIRCPPHTYNDDYGGSSVSSCSLCEAGTHCINRYDWRNGKYILVLGREDCPAGFYCPGGVLMGAVDFHWEVVVPCPRGTYQPYLKKSSVDDCLTCPEGQYCDSPGLSQPTGECDSGYVCEAGSTSSMPETAVCSEGGYCPQGTTSKESCNPGTFNDLPGGQTAKDCKDCPVGYYCSGSDSPSATGECSAGYYCTGAARTAHQYITFPGYYSLAGASAQTACDPTTYAPGYGQADACLACPGGFYCPLSAVSVPTVSPAGYYSEEGSETPVSCSAGTFSPLTSRSSSAACRSCTPGKYCNTAGATAESGDCDAGSVCLFGSQTSSHEALSTRGAPCYAGFYCPSGSSTMFPCPSGTYNTLTKMSDSSACMACPAGSYCTQMSQSAVTGVCSEGFFCSGGDFEPMSAASICPAGSYCPEGSSAAITCPSGTYSSSVGSATCQTCPAGYICGTGTSDPYSVPCPVGYYCASGSSTASACPTGTFSSRTTLNSVYECTPCTAGMYCDSTGLSEPTGLCDAGYFCTPGVERGAAVSNPTSDPGGICPIGYVCAEGTANPLPCPRGKYCSSTGLSEPDGDCVAGYLCVEGSTSATPTGSRCALGYYCPAGTLQALPCPAGTYSSSVGLPSVSGCSVCPGGRSCSTSALVASDGVCLQGFYCPSGSVTGMAVVCPIGYYCPSGSSSATACASGMYQPREGQSSCLTCPEGFECSTTTPTACPAGKYCAARTALSAAISCPTGTYRPTTGGRSLLDCYSCPSGYACPSTAMTDYSSNPCSAGYYCYTGATSQTPSLSSEGGACPIGFFCPSGSSTPTPCAPGKYCSTTLLSAPSGECSAGSFCVSQATSASSSTSLSISSCPGVRSVSSCPAGYFCDKASDEPSPCPVGFYRRSGSSLAKGLSDCTMCQQGSVCSSIALTQTSATCTSSFFCPPGSVYSNLFPCPPGYYCLAGSATPSACQPGTYNSQYNQLSCTACEAGFLCDVSGMISPSVCPAGYYCPSGSSSATACPVGTSSSFTGLQSSSQCTPCAPGKYCSSTALSAPSADCFAGSYCSWGSSLGSPSPLASNGVCTDLRVCLPGRSCPSSYYCPLGSSSGTSCPSGTLLSSEGMSDSSACETCPVSYYCEPSVGRTVCWGGFVCTGGATWPTPLDNDGGYICPLGYYCDPSTFDSEQPCSPGTFSDKLGSSSCFSCPSGFVCPSEATIVPTICPAGQYCAEGSIAAVDCPLGTFRPSTGGSALSSCLSCPAGKYCELEGLTAPTGDCDAGYICVSGASTATPSDGVYPNSNGPCSPGYYCLSGATSPSICPAGTYRSDYGGTDEASSCLACPAGRICMSPGEISDLGSSPCSAGYYCELGVSVTNPLSVVTDGGALCPLYNYCPEGSSAGTPCPVGETALVGGSLSCSTCPAGFYCGVAGSAPVSCSAGFYCPEGSSAETACPDGTTASPTESIAVQACGECELGQACTNGVSSACLAGYFCVKGVGPSTSPSASRVDVSYSTEVFPSTSSALFTPGVQIGGLCPVNHYCDLSSLYPIACATGLYNPLEGQVSSAACSDCPSGYYCPEFMTAPEPCPIGHYCPAGATTPTACAAGTANPDQLATDVSSCITCPAGTLCVLPGDTSNANPGLYDSSLYLCPVGHYCDAGATTATACLAGTYLPTVGGASISDCIECPAGFYCSTDGLHYATQCPSRSYCPAGSSSLTACPAGSYCTVESSVPTDCPAGYYCPDESDAPITCPDGSYCPLADATAPISCPSGTYFAADCHLAETESQCCVSCPAGTYASSDAQTPMYACLSCSAGYVCTGVASTPTPTDSTVDGGYICPPGYFCPAGALRTTACPVGTYRAEEGGGSVSDCLSCPEGWYNPYTGQSACLSCGSTSFSIAGSSQCLCYGSNRIFQPSTTSCICTSGYSSTDLVSGADVTRVDSTATCEPRVHSRCLSDQIRDHFGECRDPTDCASECNGGSGTRSAALGVCSCDSYDVKDNICDSECVSEQTQVRFTSSMASIVAADGTVTSEVPLSALSEMGVFNSDISLYGSCQSVYSYASELDSNATNYDIKSSVVRLNEYDTGECTTHLIGFTSDSGPFIGYMGASDDFQLDISSAASVWAASQRRRLSSVAANRRKLAQIYHSDDNNSVDVDVKGKVKYESDENENLEESPQLKAKDLFLFEKQIRKSTLIQSKTRRLQSTTNPYIHRPALCLEKGEVVVWQVTSTNYPVFLRDSLLNSVNDFDSGPFDNLKDIATNNPSSMPLYFSFTFSTDGTFVFGVPSDNDQLMIISVMSTGVLCDQYILSVSDETEVADGVTASLSSLQPSSKHSAVQAATESTLTALGARRRSDFITGLDWLFMVILLVALLVITVGSFIVFRRFVMNPWISSKHSIVFGSAVSKGKYKQSSLSNFAKMTKLLSSFRSKAVPCAIEGSLIAPLSFVKEDEDVHDRDLLEKSYDPLHAAAQKANDVPQAQLSEEANNAGSRREQYSEAGAFHSPRSPAARHMYSNDSPVASPTIAELNMNRGRRSTIFSRVSKGNVPLTIDEKEMMSNLGHALEGLEHFSFDDIDARIIQVTLERILDHSEYSFKQISNDLESRELKRSELTHALDRLRRLILQKLEEAINKDKITSGEDVDQTHVQKMYEKLQEAMAKVPLCYENLFDADLTNENIFEDSNGDQAGLNLNSVQVETLINPNQDADASIFVTGTGTSGQTRDAVTNRGLQLIDGVVAADPQIILLKQELANALSGDDPSIVTEIRRKLQFREAEIRQENMAKSNDLEKSLDEAADNYLNKILDAVRSKKDAIKQLNEAEEAQHDGLHRLQAKMDNQHSEELIRDLLETHETHDNILKDANQQKQKLIDDFNRKLSSLTTDDQRASLMNQFQNSLSNLEARTAEEIASVLAMLEEKQRLRLERRLAKKKADAIDNLDATDKIQEIRLVAVLNAKDSELQLRHERQAEECEQEATACMDLVNQRIMAAADCEKSARIMRLNEEMEGVRIDMTIPDEEKDRLLAQFKDQIERLEQMKAEELDSRLADVQKKMQKALEARRAARDARQKQEMKLQHLTATLDQGESQLESEIAKVQALNDINAMSAINGAIVLADLHLRDSLAQVDAKHARQKAAAEGDPDILRKIEMLSAAERDKIMMQHEEQLAADVELLKQQFASERSDQIGSLQAEIDDLRDRINRDSMDVLEGIETAAAQEVKSMGELQLETDEAVLEVEALMEISDLEKELAAELISAHKSLNIKLKDGWDKPNISEEERKRLIDEYNRQIDAQRALMQSAFEEGCESVEAKLKRRRADRMSKTQELIDANASDAYDSRLKARHLYDIEVANKRAGNGVKDLSFLEEAEARAVKLTKYPLAIAAANLNAVHAVNSSLMKSHLKPTINHDDLDAERGTIIASLRAQFDSLSDQASLDRIAEASRLEERLAKRKAKIAKERFNASANNQDTHIVNVGVMAANETSTRNLHSGNVAGATAQILNSNALSGRMDGSYQLKSSPILSNEEKDNEISALKSKHAIELADVEKELAEELLRVRAETEIVQQSRKEKEVARMQLADARIEEVKKKIANIETKQKKLGELPQADENAVLRQLEEELKRFVTARDALVSELEKETAAQSDLVERRLEDRRQKLRIKKQKLEKQHELETNNLLREFENRDADHQMLNREVEALGRANKNSRILNNNTLQIDSLANNDATRFISDQTMLHPDSTNSMFTGNVIKFFVQVRKDVESTDADEMHELIATHVKQKAHVLREKLVELENNIKMDQFVQDSKFNNLSPSPMKPRKSVRIQFDDDPNNDNNDFKDTKIFSNNLESELILSPRTAISPPMSSKLKSTVTVGKEIDPLVIAAEARAAHIDRLIESERKKLTRKQNFEILEYRDDQISQVLNKVNVSIKDLHVKLNRAQKEQNGGSIDISSQNLTSPRNLETPDLDITRGGSRGVSTNLMNSVLLPVLSLNLDMEALQLGLTFLEEWKSDLTFEQHNLMKARSEFQKEAEEKVKQLGLAKKKHFEEEKARLELEIKVSEEKRMAEKIRMEEEERIAAEQSMKEMKKQKIELQQQMLARRKMKLGSADGADEINRILDEQAEEVEYYLEAVKDDRSEQFKKHQSRYNRKAQLRDELQRKKRQLLVDAALKGNESAKDQLTEEEKEAMEALKRIEKFTQHKKQQERNKFFVRIFATIWLYKARRSLKRKQLLREKQKEILAKRELESIRKGGNDLFNLDDDDDNEETADVRHLLGHAPDASPNTNIHKKHIDVNHQEIAKQTTISRVTNDLKTLALKIGNILKTALEPRKASNIFTQLINSYTGEHESISDTSLENVEKNDVNLQLALEKIRSTCAQIQLINQTLQRSNAYSSNKKSLLHSGYLTLGNSMRNSNNRSLGSKFLRIADSADGMSSSAAGGAFYNF